MKKVITFGVFDCFHYGHLRLMERAKKLADEDCYLIVAVQDSEYVLKYKPNTKVVYDNEKRMEILRALRVVDEVILYKDVDKDIKNIDFDILVLGGDQNHAGFIKASTWAKVNGKKVVRLERTKGISSTQIRCGIK